MTAHDQYMHQAIEIARVGLQKGQSPFGACIVKKDQVICCVHNHVWANTDITAHAEIHAIREACRQLRTIDLSGCTIYSTCEPCPMCFSAIHWARIANIVYGAGIADAQDAGFHELTISNQVMKQTGGSEVRIDSGCCLEAARALFAEWKSSPTYRPY